MFTLRITKRFGRETNQFEVLRSVVQGDIVLDSGTYNYGFARGAQKLQRACISFRPQRITDTSYPHSGSIYTRRLRLCAQHAISIPPCGRVRQPIRYRDPSTRRRWYVLQGDQRVMVCLSLDGVREFTDAGDYSRQGSTAAGPPSGGAYTSNPMYLASVSSATQLQSVPS